MTPGRITAAGVGWLRWSFPSILLCLRMRRRAARVTARGVRCFRRSASTPSRSRHRRRSPCSTTNCRAGSAPVDWPFGRPRADGLRLRPRWSRPGRSDTAATRTVLAHQENQVAPREGAQAHPPRLRRPPRPGRAPRQFRAWLVRWARRPTSITDGGVGCRPQWWPSTKGGVTVSLGNRLGRAWAVVPCGRGCP
jgi:hypothetical protein